MYKEKGLAKLYPEHFELIKLDLNEYENYILKIKSLIYPKKLIIITHIHNNITKELMNEYGTKKRYSIIKELENICAKHNILIFYPGKFVDNKQFINDENHYTEKGMEVISEKFINFLNKK